MFYGKTDCPDPEREILDISYIQCQHFISFPLNVLGENIYCKICRVVYDNIEIFLESTI